MNICSVLILTFRVGGSEKVQKCADVIQGWSLIFGTSVPGLRILIALNSWSYQESDISCPKLFIESFVLKIVVFEFLTLVSKLDPFFFSSTKDGFILVKAH